MTIQEIKTDVPFYLASSTSYPQWVNLSRNSKAAPIPWSIRY